MRSAFDRANVVQNKDMKNALFEVISLFLIEWPIHHFHPANIEGHSVTFHTLVAACDNRLRVQESKRYAAFMFGNQVFMQCQETVKK